MKLPGVLPQLTGRWLLAYRVLWSILFLLALWGVVVGTWRAHQLGLTSHLASYKIGLRGAPQRENQWRMAPTSAEARAAGVQFGDTLVALDLLHNLYSGCQQFSSQSMGSVERDFIEAPSQLLEEWIWNYDTLRTFASNPAGEPIPKALGWLGTGHRADRALPWP